MIRIAPLMAMMRPLVTQKRLASMKLSGGQ